MLALAKIYFVVFGLITAAGGISGYVLKRSVPSLVSGLAAGALLVVAALLLSGNNWRLGLVLAGLGSVALAGRFAMVLARGGGLNPAGYLVPLGVIGIIVVVLAFLNPGR